jgi:hypothetical protein
MSGLFKTPKYTPPPEIAETDKKLEQREAKVDAEEKKELRKMAATKRAKRKGSRLLYSQDRAVPQLGVGQTLASNDTVRNPYDDERRMM